MKKISMRGFLLTFVSASSLAVFNLAVSACYNNNLSYHLTETTSAKLTQVANAKTARPLANFVASAKSISSH
jgi:hypothetical protein